MEYQLNFNNYDMTNIQINNTKKDIQVPMGSKIVESFPLTVGQVFQQYTRIPADASNILFHYTTRKGLDGILKRGGLRATCRMRMNDAGEFDYARNVVYEALSKVGRRHDLPQVARSLTTYTRKNLDRFLKDTIEMSRAYCACLTLSSDHQKQWESYAEGGNGFAIGLNLSMFLSSQASAVQRGEPNILCGPVIYNESDQHDLVWRLVETGIRDLTAFADTWSKESGDLNALRDRVTKEIVVQLLVLIDFIKAPTYTNECEFRLILGPNDGTLKAPNIQHYKRDNESISFIFMDLRMPNTRRLPLAKIRVGPKASFPKEKVFLEDLLNKLGYGNNYGDRPVITKSLIAVGVNS